MYLGLEHDGRSWVMVNERSEVVYRNEEIAFDDDTAVNWADRMIASHPGYAPPRSRWRVNVGVFPDRTYCDSHGRLGRQRLRRAWNRILDWARVS